ncbi:hypothetical protein L484_024000 [Morus notabilis]|uniref:PH domain-containing protein n=1 Tax=Morus notabilis TaxID=981085 RepID=W9RB56_9ROSA|nr:protein ENHANCED DISEASE RESISTANCE 2 [Morus notabilis]EXB62702.1 hypothetical protein L484_024000 [Morus notabilis]
MSSEVECEGWMVRCGGWNIIQSINMRYFVLKSGRLAYYKSKPRFYQAPIRTMHIDGNCRVEDRGLKTVNGHKVYVLSVYNKENYDKIVLGAFNIEEALLWKEKIELVIDQDSAQASPSGARMSFASDRFSVVTDDIED